MLKISLLFKKFTNFTGKRLKGSYDWDAKFWGYYLSMGASVWGIFESAFMYL